MEVNIIVNNGQDDLLVFFQGSRVLRRIIIHALHKGSDEFLYSGILFFAPRFGQLRKAERMDQPSLPLKFFAPVFSRPAARPAIQCQNQVAMQLHLRPALCIKKLFFIRRINVGHAPAIPGDLCFCFLVLAA